MWLYTIVESNAAHETWGKLEEEISKEFVPGDHVRRVRDTLQKLEQLTSCAKYISECRNVVLTIPDVAEGKTFDKYISGHKFEMRVEVMKSTAN